MKIIPPLFNSPRDKRVIKLVRAGKATDNEIIEAQFGEMPRGLEQATPKDEIVYFKGFSKDKDINPVSYLFRQAYTHATQPNDIFLNRGMISPLAPIAGFFATRLALARIHDVAGVALGPLLGPIEIVLLAGSMLTSFRYAMLSSLVKGMMPSVANIVGEEHAHTLAYRDDNSWLMRDRFRIAADNHIKGMSEGQQAYIGLSQAVDTLFTLMPSRYFRADHEIQARLYNIMATGYPAWKTLPQNHEEFYDALFDMGVKQPSKSLFSMNTLNNILNTRGYTDPPVAEINLGLNSTRSEEILRMYWLDGLPLFYADLLHKLGDDNGYARFGFDREDTDIYGIPNRPQGGLMPPSANNAPADPH